MHNHKKYFQLLAYLLVLTIAVSSPGYGQPPARYYYQLRTYHLKTDSQEERMDKFLQTAYLPALHRAGIKKIGVFKPIIQDSVRRLYVFIPFQTLQQFAEIDKILAKDRQYLTDGKDYLDAAYNNVPYDRMEVILLRAFEGMLRPAAPQLNGPKEERVYELRSYEGPTEKYYANKVQMFNKGEIELFKKLGFNALFYGEVLAGSKMPNLMYMTCFDNKASRDEHWKTFSADPEWKRMSALPEYQHNVSKNTQYLLVPASYSDF